MKVKELIEKLQKLDPEADVVTCDTEYGYENELDVSVLGENIGDWISKPAKKGDVLIG